MRLTRATPEAVRFACLKYHYAKSVPSVQFGYNIYNDSDEWCGVICYGSGANSHIGEPYGMCQGEILELERVALNGKQGHNATSTAVAMSVRQLKADDPVLKMIVSYADCDQNHYGTIYQATNWIYLGKKMENHTDCAWILDGKKVHGRTVSDFCNRHGGLNGLSRQQFLSKYFTTAVPHITKGKQTYIFVFDKKLRKEWQKKSVKYPKKEAVEKSCTSTSDVEHQRETVSLQPQTVINIVTTEKIVKENA